MIRRLCFVAAMFAVAACDNAVKAGNPLMAGPGYGDFVMLAEGYKIPDTVTMNDTISVPFSVGGGVHPCSFLGPMWVWQQRVFYLAAWGCRPRGESCRPLVLRLWGPNPGEPNIDSVRGSKIYYGHNPAVVYRVIVCRPTDPTTERTWSCACRGRRVARSSRTRTASASRCARVSRHRRHAYGELSDFKGT